MTDQFLTPTEVENIAALEAEVNETPSEEASAEPVETLALPETPSDLPLPTASVVPEAVVAQPEALSPKPDALPPAVLDQWQHAQSAIQQLEAQRDTLAEQYEAGVIGFKEYRAQERTLNAINARRKALFSKPRCRPRCTKSGCRAIGTRRSWSSAKRKAAALLKALWCSR